MSDPTFVYGTAWKEDDTQRCVQDALEAGFRAIDTANQRKHYFEEGVGKAINATFSLGKLKRSDLFLQTKFTFLNGQDRRLPYDPDAAIAKQVEQSFAKSLEHLHTDYLDSLVLHGPSYSRGLATEDWEAWNAMQILHEQGKTRALGISNVSLEQLKLLCERARVLPKYVQNRCYANRGWDKPVRSFCLEHGIVYQGFSLLTANQEIFGEPVFREIVGRVGCTPAQLVFRFAQQVGMLPLTGTTDPEHMREDLDCSRFELTPNELRRLEEIAL